eukprot:jgi/Chrzof1/8183/Cz03g00230.t1
MQRNDIAEGIYQLAARDRPMLCISVTAVHRPVAVRFELEAVTADVICVTQYNSAAAAASATDNPATSREFTETALKFWVPQQELESFVQNLVFDGQAFSELWQASSLLHAAAYEEYLTCRLYTLATAAADGQAAAVAPGGHCILVKQYVWHDQQQMLQIKQELEFKLTSYFKMAMMYKGTSTRTVTCSQEAATADNHGPISTGTAAVNIPVMAAPAAAPINIPINIVQA